jgi:hypothetical protein
VGDWDFVVDRLPSLLGVSGGVGGRDQVVVPHAVGIRLLFGLDSSASLIWSLIVVPEPVKDLAAPPWLILDVRVSL